MIKKDSFFWENPPWGDGKQKYRLGLKPIPRGDWLDRKIGHSLYRHKKKLLDNNYLDVVAATDDSLDAQKALSENFELKR
jgi:hypothetical protein